MVFFSLGCLVLAVYSYRGFLVSYNFFLYQDVCLLPFTLYYPSFLSHPLLCFSFAFLCISPFSQCQNETFLPLSIVFSFYLNSISFLQLSSVISFSFLIIFILHLHPPPFLFLTLKNNNLLSKPTVKQRQKLFNQCM